MTDFSLPTQLSVFPGVNNLVLFVAMNSSILLMNIDFKIVSKL